MVFGGRSSVLACSPTTAQAQRAACSGDLPEDASVGCEPPGLRDERREQVREALPVSFSISEQQLDDLEDILSEPQPSTRARAPNPWDSHEEVLILGDRPWEELEKGAWLRNMKRVSVDLGLSLVGPGTIGTVLGAATGAAAGTMLLGPAGTVAGAVYGAKGGATLGVAGAAVAGATKELIKPEGCLRDCCADKDPPPSPEELAGLSRTGRGIEKDSEGRACGSGGAERGSQGAPGGSPSSLSTEGQGWWPWSQRRQSLSQGPVNLSISVIGESAVRVELAVAGQGSKISSGTVGGSGSIDKAASQSIEGQGWWPWSQRRQSLSQRPVKLTISVVGERMDSAPVRVELAVATPHRNGQNGVIESGTGGRPGDAAAAFAAGEVPGKALEAEDNKATDAQQRWWPWQNPASKAGADAGCGEQELRDISRGAAENSCDAAGDALVSVKLTAAADEGPHNPQLVSVEIVPLAVSAQGVMPVAPPSGGSLFGDWPWYQKPQAKPHLPPTEQPGASPPSPASSSQPGKEGDGGGSHSDDGTGTEAASKAAPAEEKRKGLPWLPIWDSSGPAKIPENVPAKPGEFLLEACDELGATAGGSEGPMLRSPASQPAQQQSSVVPSPSGSLPWRPWQRPEGDAPEMPAEATQTGRRSSAEAPMPAEVPCSSTDQQNGGKSADRHHLRLSCSAPADANAGWMRLPFVSSSPPSTVPIPPSASSWLQSSKNEPREGSISGTGRNGSESAAAAAAAAEGSLTAGWGVLQKLLAMRGGLCPAPLSSDPSNKGKPRQTREDITAKLKWRSVARGQVVEALLGRAVDRLVDELVSELEDLEQAADE